MAISDYDEEKKKIADRNLDTACPAGIPCYYFELAGGLSYRGFELLRVNYGKCMTEIQGKSILV